MPGAAGAFDTFLNVQITVVLSIQLVLCLACAGASLHWRSSQGFVRYHLALNDFHEGASLGFGQHGTLQHGAVQHSVFWCQGGLEVYCNCLA